MEPPAYPQRSENTRPIASREREALDEELRRLRVTLAGYKDQHVRAGHGTGVGAAGVG